MKPFTTRAVQSASVLVFVALGVLGATCPGVTDEDDSESATCQNNGFKCINSVDPKGYTCIADPRIDNNVKVAYACLGNGGAVRYFDPSLEVVSAFESRNGTCASKPRCTR